jgi:protein-disulfide isomerase
MREGPRRNRPRLAGVIAIVAIGLIGLAVLASLSLDDGEEEQVEITGASEVQRLVGGIPQLEDRLGQDDAPVTIEVFSDLQCEGCADYHLENIDPLIADEVRDGEVKLIFRHYSQDADRATGVGGIGAESAGLQDHQWQFIELFFRNQDRIADTGIINQAFLDQIANGILNLNVEQWQRDFNESAVQDELEEDEMAAVSRRLPLEPAVVVTGNARSEELVESPSLDEIRQAISGVQ